MLSFEQGILKRFSEDIKSYADKQNSGQTPELVGFLTQNVEDYARNPNGASAKQAIDKLQQLIKDLRTVHDSDVATSAQLVTFILGNVNGSASTKLGVGVDEQTLRQRYVTISFVCSCIYIVKNMRMVCNNFFCMFMYLHCYIYVFMILPLIPKYIQICLFACAIEW